MGRSGIVTSALGIASSYGIGAKDVEHAYERGVRCFYWGSMRRPGFGEGLRHVARRHRDDVTVVLQSYTRVAHLMPITLESGLRRLGLDHCDVLLLGWWNSPPPKRIADAARALVDRGKARAVMISCHHRPTFAALAADPVYDALMVRYNAAHPGAEREVFPHLGERRPGVVSYTATRWGQLLDPRVLPSNEPLPRGSDCYRFCLSNPHVDVCLSGPKDRSELDEALEALERGPMSEEELAWMRRVGQFVHDAPPGTVTQARSRALHFLDRLMGAPS